MRAHRMEEHEGMGATIFGSYILNIGDPRRRPADQSDRLRSDLIINSYFAPRPEFFKYLKNSELGSTIIISPLFLKLCL